MSPAFGDDPLLADPLLLVPLSPDAFDFSAGPAFFLVADFLPAIAFLPAVWRAAGAFFAAIFFGSVFFFATDIVGAAGIASLTDARSRGRSVAVSSAALAASATASISSPKSSATSVSARMRSDFGAAPDAAGPALPIKSFWSTSRKTNSRAGLSSNRAPTP
jgi:hypothetical protein